MKRKRARDGAVRHDPHHHVHGFGRQGDEVPEIVMRGLRLGKVAVRLRLGGMDQVGKLDRVLDEEDRDVVADDVPVAFLGIELDRKAAHVARQVGRALAARHGGKAHKGRHALALALEQVGAGHIGQRLRSVQKSHARHSRGHAPRARECAHGRNGRSSRGSGNPPAAPGRARPGAGVFWSSATGMPCWVVSVATSPPAVWCSSPPVPRMSRHHPSLYHPGQMQRLWCRDETRVLAMWGSRLVV